MRYPTTSHPNRWLYGGYIERLVWAGEPCGLLRWGGTRTEVAEGDTVLMLRTGNPLHLVAGVEHPAPDDTVRVS